MEKTCTQCSATYTVSDDDLAFLKKLSLVINGTTYELPPPSQCPYCRQRRRLAQANQVNLYERTCDRTGEAIISNYHAESPYTVYKQEDWYADTWDPLDYGRDYDFNRPFFEQWHELSLAVPRPSMHRGFQYDENSDYTNYAGKNKNCFMVFDSDENRDCYYSYSLQRSESCIDCYRVRDSELCAECIDSSNCYNCAYVQDSNNCSDSLFLKNCIGCKYCLMCSNLRNKEYHVENKPVSKQQFEEFRARLGSHSTLQQARQRFNALKLEHPQRFMHGVQNENVVGDYLTNCKNAYHCFDSFDLWDCRHVYQAFMGLKDCMDIQQIGDTERAYESCYCGYSAHSLLGCVHALGEPVDQCYSTYSPHSQHLFGCVGVMHKQHCVLNKQYSADEYFSLVDRIITHMQSTGEWGEFFPIQTSTFAYNETIAMWYYPLNKELVQAAGWRWNDALEKEDEYDGLRSELPDSIDDCDQSIIDNIFVCATSGKRYNIIPQELKLMSQLHLPLPRQRFLERHLGRLALRNPRSICERQCVLCQSQVQTTYAPDRPEIIYCEACFNESVI